MMRRKEKIDCVNSSIPPSCTLEPISSPSATGVGVSARNGAIRIGNVIRIGKGDCVRAGHCKRADAPTTSASSPALHSMSDASHGRIERKVSNRGVGGITAQRMDKGGLSRS